MPTEPRPPGYADLRDRVRALPAIVRATVGEPLQPLAIDVDDATGFVVTGVGSSAAHARLIAQQLGDALGLRARFKPLGAFVETTPRRRGREVLVVVSQGLSPNARIPLRDLSGWAGVVLLTAATVAGAQRAGDATTAATLRALEDAGVHTRRFAAGEQEYGTLVRIVGPMVGSVAALRFVEAVAEALGVSAPVAAEAWTSLPAALEAAPATTAGIVAATPSLVARLRRPLALLAAGDYVSLVDNLRYKVLEGMLAPLPPVLDILHLAHGPFQQLHAHETILLALTRTTSTVESDLLARVEAMLVPDRHTLVRLPAQLPAPLALFEHEAILNELMLRVIAAAGIDQEAWPGRGADRPLYEISAPLGAPNAAAGGGHVREVKSARLEWSTWPEVARRLAAGPVTAVLPLGSTEQHGSHLPFATDSWIAEALGLRFCAQVPGALLLPVLPLGCAAEHLGFQGTLALRPETLAMVLADVVRSLRAHGFARTFIFSAHGGNAAALARALPALRHAGAPMAVDAHTDLAGLTRRWHEASAAHGIAAGASGHHAGEYETSIVRMLRPGTVRVDALAAGHVAPVDDPQGLFYPSLARTVPSGTVGDPRPADAARGASYLDAWAALLVSTYRLEKKRAKTTGT